MYKYNLYDNGEIVFKNVKGDVIRKTLGIEYSAISELVKKKALYKGRYAIERIGDEEVANAKESRRNKKHYFGEDILKEWDEVVMLFRLQRSTTGKNRIR